jgi:hypothetical protein
MVPRLIVSGVGILLVLTPLITRPGPENGSAVSIFFAYIDRNFSVWFNILAVFAFILGAASLLRTHLQRVWARGRDWQYSLVTLAAFASVLIVGLLKVGGAPGLQGDVAAEGTMLTWVFAAIYSPLKSTIYSLLAFFVASAAFRAFRLHSLTASLLLASAFVVLLGRTPFGIAMTSWLPAPLHFLRIDVLSLWLMTVPNTAGWRAILIGIALGVVTMSLRLVLGLERHAYGGGRR